MHFASLPPGLLLSGTGVRFAPLVGPTPEVQRQLPMASAFEIERSVGGGSKFTYLLKLGDILTKRRKKAARLEVATEPTIAAG